MKLPRFTTQNCWKITFFSKTGKTRNGKKTISLPKNTNSKIAARNTAYKENDLQWTTILGRMQLRVVSSSIKILSVYWAILCQHIDRRELIEYRKFQTLNTPDQSHRQANILQSTHRSQELKSKRKINVLQKVANKIISREWLTLVPPWSPT